MVHHARRQDLPRRVDEPQDVVVAKSRGAAERADARDEQDFGSKDVADAGDDALIEQDVTDRLASACANPADGLVAIE